METLQGLVSLLETELSIYYRKNNKLPDIHNNKTFNKMIVNIHTLLPGPGYNIYLTPLHDNCNKYVRVLFDDQIPRAGVIYGKHVLYHTAGGELWYVKLLKKSNREIKVFEKKIKLLFELSANDKPFVPRLM